MPTSSTSVCVTTTTATRDSESGSARARGSITREFRVAPEKTNARVAGAARLAIPQARQMVRHVRARQLDTDRGRIMRASANIVTLGREVLCYPDHRPDHRRQLPTRRPFTPSDRTHADRERPQRVDTRGCQRQLGRLSLSATKRREKRAIYRCDSQMAVNRSLDWRICCRASGLQADTGALRRGDDISRRRLLTFRSVVHTSTERPVFNSRQQNTENTELDVQSAPKNDSESCHDRASLLSHKTKDFRAGLCCLLSPPRQMCQ